MSRALPEPGWHLHFDCPTGVAGDMTLAALLHLGVPLEVVQAALTSLDIPGLSVDVEDVKRGGLQACHLVAPAEAEDEPHRSYADIKALLEAPGLDARVRQLAEKIFARLAEAEAEVHGVSVDKVHFHEVGGLDALADIVGVAAAMCHLAPASISASALPLGDGTVKTMHGRLPVPAPATVALLVGVPTVPSPPGSGELVTPTGAAIVATLATQFGSPPAFELRAWGHGAGTRELAEGPNILRLLAGPRLAAAAVADDRVDEAFRFERPETDPPRWIEAVANIDDMNPEWGPHLIERLLEAGAADAWLAPLTTKKGRAGIQLGLLCRREDLPAVARCALAESTTIGLRYHPVWRAELPRRRFEVETPYGRVHIKAAGQRPRVNLAPEFEDCRRLALETGVPLKEIYRAALAAAGAVDEEPEGS